jgi:glutathione S-transferase
MQLLDAQLQKTAFVAGGAFSCGDIPVGVMTYRYVNLIPERPAMKALDRWYAALASRPAFKEHCGSIPLT